MYPHNPHAAMGGSHLLPMTSPRVDYMYGDKGPFLCAHCRYFIKPSACAKVAGRIDPQGCCNLYETINANQRG